MMRLLRLARRCVHTSTDDTRQLLRQLLRETAQSVAVVTAILPDHVHHSAQSSPTTYHGATLSSFSSIALDPHPLVAFSLRVPSRMASALNFHITSPSASSSSSSSLLTPPSSAPSDSAHLIINILSAAQPHVADRFARPDLHTRPFADPQVHWTTSQDGLPILSGALGALSCRLVGPSVSLAHIGAAGSDIDAFSTVLHGRTFDDVPVSGGEPYSGRSGGDISQASAATGLSSELFIGRVLRVEHVPFPEDDERDPGRYKLPLLYHRRRYTTIGDGNLAES